MKNYSPKKSNSSQQFWLLKTFVFYIFCCLLSTFYLYAQTPITQWQKAIGGSGDEYLWDIQKTSDGGSIEVGASSSSDGDISLNQGAYDVLVVKLNSAGTVEWEKTFGGSGDDFGYSIQQTSDGGYIVGAYTNSIDGNITAPKGGDDYWVIKLDATGNLQWQKSLGGTGEDFIGNVRQTTDGGYIVSGNSSSSDGDVSSNHGGDDVWMVKLNATGTTIEWQKTYGGSGNDECYNGEPTTDGGYIVAAYSDSNDGDISFNHGSNDIWVIKLDTAGNLQWQKTLGGSGDDNIPYIHQTSDGGFIFTCTTSSTDGDITGTHYGATDIWVVKLNSTGIIQWQKTFGGSAVDNASSIQQTSDGGYLISSFTLSTDIPNITNHGNIDILLIKINNSGVMQWQNYYGGSSWDQPANAYQANDGSYVFAGASASSDGDITGNHGGSDTWTVKILKYTAIPDTNFEQALFDLGIDTVNGDHRVLTDAISGLTTLNVSFKNIADLTGIQDFAALNTLNCDENTLTSLNVSSNINLTELNCNGDLLTNLDVSHNTNLSLLSCYNNQLNSLDVSNNLLLNSLECGINHLTSLNVSVNTGLNYLGCSTNMISSLNTSSNTMLDTLICDNNQLTSINVSNNLLLTDLDCGYNQLTTLDVSANAILWILMCDNNQITNITGINSNFVDLRCQYNLLTSLDVSIAPHINNLYCDHNLLTSLKVCNNTELNFITCDHNQLTSLDLRDIDAVNLISLEAANNYISNIYVNNLSAATAHNVAGEWNKDATAIFSTTTSAGGNVTSNQTICSGAQPNDLILTGNVGDVVIWQKSTNNDFLNNVTDIANSNSILTSTEIGTINVPTYFRAEIKLSTCSTAYSSPVLISTGSSTSWNGSIWSNGTPDITKGIILNSNYTSNTDISGCTMNVTNNATVIINSGTNVNLFGALTVDSGSTFTLNNNSNLLQVSNVQNTGNIVVKRDTSPLYRLDYEMWSSPVSSVQSLTNFSPLTTINRFYTYNTTTNLYNAISAPSTTTFSLGKGYLIRMPNNWVNYSNTAIPMAWTGVFSGTPNNGIINVGLIDGGSVDTRYNAVGNPYPSSISMSDLFSSNSNAIEGTLWFWRKTNDANNPVSYSTCSNAGCTLNNAFTFYSNFDMISPGQGFIVRSKANQTNLSFTNTMRYADNTDQFFKTNQNEKDRFWLELKNSANTSFGQFLMAYLPEATLNYDDGLDGLFINDSQTVLSAIVDNNELVIEARPSFDVQDVAPLQFRTNQADTYTISLHSTEGIFSTNQDIFIRDNQTGLVQNLKESNFSFTANNIVYPGRFDLLYQYSSLATSPQLFNENNVVVYKNNQTIFIDTALLPMSAVKVFDVRGRLLIEKTKVNETKTTIDTSQIGNQLLLVQITLEQGNLINKKIMN